jgi:MFS transporter, DHA2 family, multidrug resistance protein
MAVDVRTGRSRWLALGALVLSGLVLSLDSIIVVTALPTFSAELAATTNQLQWISAAYMLALAGLQIPAGVLGDRLGRRRVLLAAITLFCLSSLGASQVTTATGLIVMRMVMGVAGACIFPVCMAAIPSIFSADARQRAMSIGGAGMFLGLPLGPLVGGWLLTHYEWGSIFLINVPLVAIALLAAWFFVPESRDPSPSRLDLAGVALAIASVTSLVYATIEQPARGWRDARVLGSLLAGTILLAGFIRHELRTRSPLIDLRLFADRRFSGSVLVSMVMSFALMGLLFVLTPFLQVVEGNDAQATGVRLLPLIGGMMAGSFVGDRLVRRLGARAMLVLGLLFGAAGLTLISLVGPDHADFIIAIALPAVGIGNAFAMFIALNVILEVVPASQAGGGAAVARTLQQVASSFGVAILGSVLNPSTAPRWRARCTSCRRGQWTSPRGV